MTLVYCALRTAPLNRMVYVYSWKGYTGSSLWDVNWCIRHLKSPKQCCCGFRSPEMWHRVAGWLPTFQRNRILSFSIAHQSPNLDRLTLQNEGLVYLRNVWDRSPDDMSNSRRPEPSFDVLVVVSFEGVEAIVTWSYVSWGTSLTLTVLMWRIGWAHNNARK